MISLKMDPVFKPKELILCPALRYVLAKCHTSEDKEIIQKATKKKKQLICMGMKITDISFLIRTQDMKRQWNKAKTKIIDNLITRHFQAGEDSEVYLKCTLSKE